MRAAMGLPACIVLAVAGGAMGWWMSTEPVATKQRAERAASAPEESVQPVASRPAEELPKVLVPEPTFDFGVMDRGEPGRKQFTIVNEGTAPLRLQVASTSCKCTLADLGEDEQALVAPGRGFVITLEWDTTDSNERFRHGAVIQTNDPCTPEFELVVEGRIREHLTIQPSLVFFSQLGLSESRTQQVVLYSEAFDTLDIVKVDCSLPQLHCEVTEADEELKRQLEVRQARVLHLTIEPGLPLGPLAATVDVHFEATGGNPKMRKSPYTFSVLGEVVSDVSIHGRRVEGNLLRFPPVRQEAGARETVYLFVRGAHRDLEIRDIQTSPEYLQVSVERDDLEGARSARYRLTVQVPPGARPVTLGESNPGTVELTTNHPDAPKQKFYVHLSVIP